MSLRGPLFTLLTALACQGCGSDNTNPAEKRLFDRLQIIVKDGKPAQQAIVSAFRLPPACLGKYCDFTLTVESGFEGTGVLKQSDGGVIFELSQFHGQKIRTEEVKHYFATTAPEEGCCDAPCWYLNSYNDWGLLAFGVDRPSSDHISSVVINTEEYGRTVSARAKARANDR